MTANWKLGLGANLTGSAAARFKVWAPRCSRVEIQLLNKKHLSKIPMAGDSDGYFSAEVRGASPGDRYYYSLDGGNLRPDPVSRCLPEGVHGPTSIVDPMSFRWTDSGWKGIALRDMILYEIHIGTFTPSGTFEAAIRKLAYLKELGISCVEVMPAAQFPGKRNWGYDGAGLFAVQNSYGGPGGFKRFVDACHRRRLAVCLDVVYNHLGPEGNYLHEYGPYFTKKYHTPWGDAVNYDDAYSGGVRRFVIENALYWVSEYHVDALRLDAVHGIFDFSARHILEELNEAVQKLASHLGRKVHVIAESDLNDSRIIRPKTQGGYGLDAQWSDDFHHAVHAYLTGERSGYYEDFGRLEEIAKALRDGFVYDGRYSPFRKRHHGNVVKDLPPEKLVVCIQNHDQVGNRALGDRLSVLVSFESLKLAAALLVLSPFTPLLFMGEEYGEMAPFQYFVDHGDPNLLRSVREGRRREFASFGWSHIPDPGSKHAFEVSKLSWASTRRGNRRFLLRLYKDLISFRKKLIRNAGLSGVWFDEANRWLAMEYAGKSAAGVGMLISFSDREQRISIPFAGKRFIEILNTQSVRYGGRLGFEKRSHHREIILPPFCAVIGRLRS